MANFNDASMVCQAGAGEVFATFAHTERRTTTMQKEAKYRISTTLIALACATCTGLSADEQQPPAQKAGQRRIGLLEFGTRLPGGL